jgi:hypothetical protein
MSDFTAEDAAKANAVLRGALGLEPQRFSVQQFVGMASDEIEQLRAAGKSDEEIVRLLKGAGIEVAAADIARYYAPPEARRFG